MTRRPSAERGPPSRPEVREAILEAARRLLRSQGLASTRELARAAGVADGALYNHFEDRVAVYVALLEESVPSLSVVLSALPLRVGVHEVTDNLEWVGAELVAFHDRVVPLFGALLGERPLLERYQARLAASERGPHRSRDPIVAYLRAEQRLGRVAAGVDVEIAVQVFVAACFQRVFQAHFDGAALRDPGPFVRGVVRTLFTGLAPP